MWPFALSADDWQALWLTVQLAVVSTGLLLLCCLPIAWWVARGRSLGRQSALAVSALPLALPPTVMGFLFIVISW